LATATETAQNPTPSATPPKRTLGLADHGRAMTLEAYEACDFEEGVWFELARGIIVVTEVPGVHHGRIVRRVARMFDHYDEAHAGRITYLAGGAECRLRLPGMQSDRHPDQAVYLTPEPKAPSPWNHWIPAIVVEVISPRSGDRDYVDKREEYLRAGVLEYWILDPKLRRLMVLQRLGDIWQEMIVPVGETYETHLLPGLVVDPGTLLGPEDDLQAE
jgi:Uma2 family endonuclease